MMRQINVDRSNYPFALVLPAISAVFAIFITFTMIFYAGYGFDFTDDGFYLVRIAYPFSTVPAISHFGVIYYPLYALMQGSISGLRAFNVLATWGSAVVLSLVVLKAIEPQAMQGGRKELVLGVLSAIGLSSVSLAMFNTFLITPNYNSLALQALMITSAGLILASPETTRASVGGWVMVSIGGWLALLAKPSTAGALAIVAFVYLLASGKLAFRMAFASALLAALLVVATSLYLDGSFMGLAMRIQDGVERTRLLDDGHTIGELLRRDPFAPTDTEQNIIWIGAAAMAVLLFLTTPRHLVVRVAAATLGTAIAAIAGLVMWGLAASPLVPTYSQHLILVGPIFALAIAAPLRASIQGFQSAQSTNWRARWCVAGLLTAMPFLFTFGSLDNYWYSSSSAVLFWALAVLVLAHPFDRDRPFVFVAPVGIALQALTALLISNGLEWPYRQPQPVRSFDAVASVGPHNAQITMTAPFARYISEMRAMTRGNGFTDGTPVIDLSGQSPGALFAIGADNLGQAWMIGGYKGSMATAVALLKRQECADLARAWILTEPNGPRAVSERVLLQAGLSLKDFHERVGSIATPVGGGGFSEARQQIIYKPVSVEAIESDCRKRRN